MCSTYGEGLLEYSVEFCYNQAIRHNLEESSNEEKRKLFPFLSSSADDTSLKNLKVPTRSCVIEIKSMASKLQQQSEISRETDFIVCSKIIPSCSLLMISMEVLAFETLMEVLAFETLISPPFLKKSLDFQSF